MVAIVLLVTCANIANLLLARGTSRSRETGIRLALGATRGRLVRQYVTESLLLSCAGGIASIVAAQWTSGWLARAVITRSGELPPVFASDWRVWVFTAGLSIASALAFGLVPALRTIQAGFIHGISAHQRVTAHAALKGMRPLVAVQLALCFAMVFGAVLLGRTLAYFGRIDPGFEPEHLVSAAIDPDSSGYNRDQTMALVDPLLTAVQSLPGVRSASLSTCGLVANCSYRSGFQIEDAGGGHNINNNWIAPGYFATVGIPVVAGRDFSDRDTAQSARVAVISESVARRYFAGQNPIGKRLGYQKKADAEIVGVVRDARSITLRDPPIPMVYFPISQPPSFRPFPHSLDVRVSGDAALAITAIRQAIARAEPGLLVDGVSPMSARLDRNFSRERLIAYLASGFGLLALVLASVGLYGVLSYTVARRTQEIGVRMALGARPGDLTRMVIGDGTRVVVVGTIVGAFAAIGVGRLIKTLLVGVNASDPITYVAVAVALVGISLAASYIPARRAARVNPIAALRME
jgi:predicted permease